MDALPLQEESGLPFASEVAGAMHACGHDTHVAMLLGAARMLAKRRSEMEGRVTLMFQPGEEGYHGARLMLQEGLLRDVNVATAAAFALHTSTRFPSGTLNLRDGQILAAPDSFTISVRGRGGHASSPHATVDPIPVAAEVVMALQAMVTRRFNVFDPVVVTVGHIEAGTTHNITPESAFIEGTIRTLSPGARDMAESLLRRVVDGVCAAHGAQAEVTVERGYPATVNDPDIAHVVRETAAQLIGADRVLTMEAPLMGGEDFSYVLQQVPGAYAFLGARPDGEDPSTSPVNHSNRVVFDEAPMAVGVALYVAVALRLLLRPSAAV
jgi:hippurate hydrolase